MFIDVVQYTQPTGKRKEVGTNISDDCKENYQDMVKAGFRIAAEILYSKEISLTIENHEKDVDIEVVGNGPAVQEAIEKMIKRKKWK